MDPVVLRLRPRIPVRRCVRRLEGRDRPQRGAVDRRPPIRGPQRPRRRVGFNGPRTGLRPEESDPSAAGGLRARNTRRPGDRTCVEHGPRGAEIPRAGHLAGQDAGAAAVVQRQPQASSRGRPGAAGPAGRRTSRPCRRSAPGASPSCSSTPPRSATRPTRRRCRATATAGWTRSSTASPSAARPGACGSVRELSTASRSYGNFDITAQAFGPV